MELKKYTILLMLIFFSSELKADLIKPDKKFNSFDVIKIQLEALKNNDEKDSINKYAAL